MLTQSYGRLLGTRSALVGLVTLALLLAVTSPAAGSITKASSGHRSRMADAAEPFHVAMMIPADTDTTDYAVPTTRSSHERGGYVVTSDQLYMEQDYPLSSVIAAHFPGIRVIHGSDMDRVASGLHLDLTGTPCFLQIFMDGVLVENGGMDWVNVRDLASIEYRTPGNIPVQFQNREPGSMCGALLLWSKYS